VSAARQLILFFSISFAFTWTVMAWIFLAQLRIEYGILASCGPIIAALVTNRVAFGHWRAFRFKTNWLRILGASALGIVLVWASEIIFPTVAVADASKLNWTAAFLSLSAYNYSTLLGGPLFEEPGWRGFALPRLESCFGPFKASLILGTIWAAWHLPFFWYPGWTECPIPTYFLILTGLSVLMTHVTNLARFSVIAPMLMHAAHNTSGEYFRRLFGESTPGNGGFLNDIVRLILVPLGWNGNINISFYTLIALGAWVAAGLLLLFTKGRLGYSKADRYVGSVAHNDGRLEAERE
jgi:uncharacterized protein